MEKVQLKVMPEGVQNAVHAAEETVKVLKEKHGINIDYAPVIPTIVSTFLNQLNLRARGLEKPLQDAIIITNHDNQTQKFIYEVNDDEGEILFEVSDETSEASKALRIVIE
jgi:regulatory protein YycH of two-component signal transduction system YycFG